MSNLVDPCAIYHVGIPVMENEISLSDSVLNMSFGDMSFDDFIDDDDDDDDFTANGIVVLFICLHVYNHD